MDAGVVRLIVPKSIEVSIAPYLLEQTMYPISNDEDNKMIFNKEEIDKSLEKIKALAIGMGWGSGKDNEKILAYILEKKNIPCIIDADGLNTLAKMNLNILKDKMAIANKSDSNKFDYFEIVYNDFIYDNEPTLIILSRFINFIGYERLYNNCNSNKTIIITEKDYNNLTYDINYGYNTTPIMFSSDFINLAKNLINCEVIILRHINNYSISEINYILTSNDNNALVRKLISIYNFIPYWVSEIISVPNYFKQYIGDKTSDDIFILNNLELLKTYVWKSL